MTLKRLAFLALFSFIPSGYALAAWTSIGDLGSDQNKTSADPYVFHTSATLEVGNIAVCLIATDNDGNGTDTDDFAGVTDDAGNTWVNIGMNENDNGAAAAGAALAIYYTKATSQLNSGANITVDLAAARTSKAATCWEFSGGVVSSTGTEQKEDTSGTTPIGALTIGSLPSAEHLWIRGVAGEQAAAEIDTYTASWTSFVPNGTTGGVASGNMWVIGEFIIDTATTATSDPAETTTGRDRASSLVALDEATGGGGGGGEPAPRRIIIGQ